MAESRRTLKMIAMQLVPLLPSAEADALCVLGYAGELVSAFLAEKPAPRNVVPIRGKDQAASDSNLE